jgi:hypothetical protein
VAGPGKTVEQILKCGVSSIIPSSQPIQHHQFYKDVLQTHQRLSSYEIDRKGSKLFEVSDKIVTNALHIVCLSKEKQYRTRQVLRHSYKILVWYKFHESTNLRANGIPRQGWEICKSDFVSPYDIHPAYSALKPA